MAKMITNGRLTNNSLLPGTTSSNTICIPPPISPSYATQPTQIPIQFNRIHTRSFFPNQTMHITSSSKGPFDIPTKIMFYTLFFIMCSCALTTLAYIFSYMCKRFVTKLQKRYEYESYGELERLVARRIVPGYLTFDRSSLCDAEGNGRPVSADRSTENAEPIKANRIIKTTKATNDHDGGSNWESALPTPNPRKIGLANLPQPIRRPPTTKEPTSLHFAASPLHSPRPNRPNPPRRLFSPPLPPSFLAISNATRAPMPIPGQESSSWDAGSPWVTAADGVSILRDEGKLERAMSPNDAEWGDVDRLISIQR